MTNTRMALTVTVALAALFVLAQPVAGQEAEEETEIVATYEGNGISTLRPFTVDGPWEIVWDATGADLFQVSFEVEVQGLDDVKMPKMAANQAPGDTGSSYHPDGGTFTLAVNAIGPWEIIVRRVEP